MPALEIFTNVKEDSIPADFFPNLSSVFQKAIGKPEKVIIALLKVIRDVFGPIYRTLCVLQV